MTKDGRFTWNDMDAAIDADFAGLDFGSAMDMVSASLDDPVVDDAGTTMDPARFDRGAAEAYLLTAVGQSFAARTHRMASELAAEDAAEVREITGNAISAVTGVPAFVVEQARQESDAGDASWLSEIYSDYVERS